MPFANFRNGFILNETQLREMTLLSPPSHPRLFLAAATTALAAALLPIPPAHAQNSPEGEGDLVQLATQAQEIASNLEIQSNSTVFDESLGIAKAMGDVEIRYGNVIIQCQQAEFHHSSGKVFARDDVTIYKDGGIFNGEEVIYDTKTGEMTSSNLRSALEPLYYQSSDLNVPTQSTDMIEMRRFLFHDARLRQSEFPGDRKTDADISGRQGHHERRQGLCGQYSDFLDAVSCATARR